MTLIRHPEAHQRPDFNELSTKLSVSNSKLLQKENKTELSATFKLGADLSHGDGIYENLHRMYHKWAVKTLKNIIVTCFLFIFAIDLPSEHCSLVTHWQSVLIQFQFINFKLLFVTCIIYIEQYQMRKDRYGLNAVLSLT